MPMKNRTKFLISIFTILIISFIISEYSLVAIANSTGAPIGKTGSPGDGFNCTSCHSGVATTEPNLITSNIPSEGYTPGQTYTITGTITATNTTKFGFEIAAQNFAGVNQGTYVVTNITTTKLIGNGNYITHKTGGTSFPSGTATWSFDWIAPTIENGDITFYGAFISSNNNNNSNGESVKLSTLALSKSTSAKTVDWINNKHPYFVFPNPFFDKLYITKSANAVNPKLISISDINGKLVKEIENNLTDQPIDVNEIARGTYFLKIVAEDGIRLKKIVKE